MMRVEVVQAWVSMTSNGVFRVALRTVYLVGRRTPITRDEIRLVRLAGNTDPHLYCRLDNAYRNVTFSHGLRLAGLWSLKQPTHNFLGRHRLFYHCGLYIPEIRHKVLAAAASIQKLSSDVSG